MAGCLNAQNPKSGARAAAGGSSGIRLSPADLQAIGRKIWQNECNGTIEGLTSWNSGEEFASLGIGHFIWYVPGRPGPFDESFPKLIRFMQSRRVPMPGWLPAATAKGCPWPNRSAFLAKKNSPQMKELRQFLANTIAPQTDFIVLRLEQAMPKMLKATSNSADRERLKTNFYKVAQTPQGVYALIDYVNFKGEGVKPEERYRGQGWGLRDVLLEMRDTHGGAAAANEYSEAAKRVLRRRVKNSPPERGESRWLRGWMNRCEGYRRGV
jgi:hypothetical protein